MMKTVHLIGRGCGGCNARGKKERRQGERSAGTDSEGLRFAKIMLCFDNDNVSPVGLERTTDVVFRKPAALFFGGERMFSFDFIKYRKCLRADENTYLCKNNTIVFL